MTEKVANPFIPVMDAFGDRVEGKTRMVVPVCGFKPWSSDVLNTAGADGWMEEVDARGQIVEYRIDQGVKIPGAVKGTVKQRLEKDLYQVVMAKVSDLQDMPDEHLKRLTVGQHAARNLALSAAGGDRQSVTELFDRVLGKPKQVTENYSVVRTIDDVLNEAFDGEDTISYANPDPNTSRNTNPNHNPNTYMNTRIQAENKQGQQPMIETVVLTNTSAYTVKHCEESEDQ